MTWWSDWIERSQGEEGLLLLMATPFVFLLIVIPIFIWWLWNSRTKSDANTEKA